MFNIGELEKKKTTFIPRPIIDLFPDLEKADFIFFFLDLSGTIKGTLLSMYYYFSTEINANP